MYLRLRMTALTALVALIISVLLYTPPLQAAPGQPQTAAAPTQSKVILGDTSIDGPALATIWAASSASESVLAWTGADAAHHLNVETSTDGMRFGQKLILDETSPYRPDVALATVGGPVAVAWTGSDPQRTLNVLYDVYGSQRKLTLWGETSISAPALLIGPGMYLAWTGTDPHHSLNIMALSATSSGLTAGDKTILSQDSSLAGPHLARGSATVTTLSWTSPSHHLMSASATYPAGLEPGITSAQTSAAAPSVFAVGPFLGVTNERWTAWTGTDAAHHLNLQSPSSQTILGELAYGGPALSYFSGLQLAWTGTDPARHLNVSIISEATVSTCAPAPEVQPVSSTPIYRGNTTRNEVSLTFDSDGGSAGNAATYLTILERNHLRATFFLTGAFAQAHPDIVRRMVADGDDIGNHTLDHPDLANPPRTDAFVCNELTSADSIIASAAGQSSRPYFRPPYGSSNSQVATLAARQGYRTILWSIDPADYSSATTTQDIINRVLGSPNLKPGAIILMHINSPNEQYALQTVITGLTQTKGFNVVPLSELLR